MTAETLETETCGRCNGGGRHSYNQTTGSRCFGCGGKGRVLTARGKAASQWLTDQRSQRADAFTPGDLVQLEMVGGGTIAKYFATVETVRTTITTGSVNGEPFEREMIVLECSGKFGYAAQTVLPDRMLRKGFDAETKAAQFAQALAYQATLDARGRPLPAAA